MAKVAVTVNGRTKVATVRPAGNIFSGGLYRGTCRAFGVSYDLVSRDGQRWSLLIPTSNGTHVEPVEETGLAAARGVLQLLKNEELLFLATSDPNLVFSLLQEEAAARGINKNGAWIGFDAARKEWL